jgi:hypothetical protein
MHSYKDARQSSNKYTIFCDVTPYIEQILCCLSFVVVFPVPILTTFPAHYATRGFLYVNSDRTCFAAILVENVQFGEDALLSGLDEGLRFPIPSEKLFLLCQSLISACSARFGIRIRFFRFRLV